MAKIDVAEMFAKSLFDDSNFQEKWQGYLQKYGNDIGDLFKSSYKSRIHFSATLENMSNGNYEDALRDLNSYVSACTKDEEKNTIIRLISECESHILPKTYPKKSDRYMKYRDQLLVAGLCEAKQKYGHFYWRTTEKAAFVINLEDNDNRVEIMYGFASTAYMAGEEECFDNNGSDNDTCQVRNILYISDDSQEENAQQLISALFTKYKDCTKDDILEAKKERQKIFLSNFASALKPLGFKKKGARWTKDLNNGTALSFEAQKSAYSDQYYFNVIIHDIDNFYSYKTYERVVMYDDQIYNWQLMSDEDIENLIKLTLTDYINPKLLK